MYIKHQIQRGILFDILTVWHDIQPFSGKNVEVFDLGIYIYNKGHVPRLQSGVTICKVQILSLENI